MTIGGRTIAFDLTVEELVRAGQIWDLLNRYDVDDAESLKLLDEAAPNIRAAIGNASRLENGWVENPFV